MPVDERESLAAFRSDRLTKLIESTTVETKKDKRIGGK